MKKVFENSMVAHVWNAQTQSAESRCITRIPTQSQRPAMQVMLGARRPIESALT